MQKQQGFTLIELVVVIIILGILAVTAAPKFINLQGDARVSTLQGAKAAIQSANSLVYSKAALAGVEKGDTDGKATVDIGTGTALNVVYGYTAGTVTDIINAVDISSDDWTITESSGVVSIQQVGAPAGCNIIYTESQSEGALPIFTSDAKDEDGDALLMPTASEC
ncbi:hypothetical protein BCU84_09475 [Shewanella sp. 10N.286.51.B7]|uniref:prepilin-type N-terminal cleavage/methylation domain-containing protein n=1 Tax=Shewanella sp. 10N.286.51.B7 TaxID=1880836 RepID=UPI000C81CC17|nr:prepilin-type N-terminal cleavage/methylation domain-containing protein [Shewanella sp. 10N.286.51.B7]PMG77916.1 hypothetical protein BCU84_09475 [Shewanella sp. 10N.286.51.B7]